jgi:hypothetical protein
MGGVKTSSGSGSELISPEMETINRPNFLPPPRKHKLKAIRSLRMVAILAASAIPCIATATQSNRFPLGKYCGELLSNGIMAEAQTTFGPSVTDGKISGSYVFFEEGQTVTGLLAEPSDDGDGNDLTRNLVWQDKYPTGIWL